jgi:hypothetical protein
VRAAQKLLGAPTIGGGSAQAGAVVEGVKGDKYAPCRPKCTKPAKNRLFLHFLAYKLLKMPFFPQKYLTRYTPETFLSNTLILNFFVT